jgi:hypothetical protein
MFPTMIEHRCSEGCRGSFESGTQYLDGRMSELYHLKYKTLAE